MLKHTNEVQQLLDRMRNEIATELGIEIGADASSKVNGQVGGEMTKRLIQLGEMKLQEMSNQQTTNSFMYQQNQPQSNNELH
jgi:Tfp pilus assembly ATPase PilU